MASNAASRAIVHYAHLLTYWVDAVANSARRIPGSEMVVRYVRSSYQNDPVRSVIEFSLLLFCIVYLLKRRFSTEKSNRVILTEDEIEDLVRDWVPEPIVDSHIKAGGDMEKDEGVIVVGPCAPKSKLSNGRVVTNLASYNHYNFNSSEALKEKAVATLRTYGVGPCGPPNFYGTQDVHMQTEADIAAHLGVSSCIVYAQAFSTISSVIPAFCKRGDIVVADRAVNYSIRKGLQLSRSTVYWYAHNDMEDLERVLAMVVKSNARKPLTRRFIVAEGLYENIGDMADLPKLIQLKTRYKFRIMLDETWSYGVLGATGRGITELQHVDPTSVDMIIGSLAGALCAGGGFCAGSEEVVTHQRISSASYTFSAALPAILATTASETVRSLTEQPELGITLRENIKALRAQLDPRSDWVSCQSAPENPIQLVLFKDEVVESRDMTDNEQESLLSEIVEECLSNGVLITKLKAMPQTLGASARDLEKEWQPPPALKICVTTGLSKKEIEKAGTVIRHAVTKIMTRKK